MPRPTRSISLPIILASITVALSIALLIGWTLIIGRNWELTQQPASENYWLLIGGITSFVFICAVLVWMVIFLVREMLEVRRQNSFIDSVTHELKSPLASISLCAETLQKRDLTPEQKTELLGMITDDVDRLGIFVDDVLTASQLASGQDSYQLGEVNVVALIQSAIGRIARRYKLSPKAIEFEPTGDFVMVTDPVGLETVVNNLLDNAVKYSRDDVRIIVTIRTNSEGSLLLSVRDTGIGISVAHRKRIFERFYRAPGENILKRSGTGLGLFVVASLIRKLGGKVRAFSEGHNTGTTMEVVLPNRIHDRKAVPRG